MIFILFVCAFYSGEGLTTRRLLKNRLTKQANVPPDISKHHKFYLCHENMTLSRVQQVFADKWRHWTNMKSLKSHQIVIKMANN